MTSAQDFVDRIASFSGTSGKPYLIRFQDGKEIQMPRLFVGRAKKDRSACTLSFSRLQIPLVERPFVMVKSAGGNIPHVRHFKIPDNAGRMVRL